MSQDFDFNKLFIFEMANNHAGDLAHGSAIIREIRKVCNGFDFKFGFKLQYRDMDTFIHPDYKGKEDSKYVKRFEETRLSHEALKALKDEIRSAGFISICTPFDEASVDLIEAHGFDIIKIGSCSFDDWPLLERVVKTDAPLIISTGGASQERLDKVVAFLEHRKKVFCLLHCVSLYPSPDGDLQLNQINFLRTRYPAVAIGYSGHENPDTCSPVTIAIAKGACVFERHVGLPGRASVLNKYSSTPTQVEKWLQSAQEAFTLCGAPDTQRHIAERELHALRDLQRGVFAKSEIVKGEKINLANTFLAIPNVAHQLLANELSKYTEYTVIRQINKNQPVLFSDVASRNLRERVLQIINAIKDILIKSNVSFPDKVGFELSHHYGIENFEKCGAAIISCINREYCKKILVLLPGQTHPVHYHKKKEENFCILYGDFSLNLNGVDREYKPGDMVIVERGAKHSFSSRTGVVFEEISTTHFPDDSYYDDPRIAENKERKTVMTFWSDWLSKPVQ